ncbi:MAG: tetratricopeptide repeat protein [Candidatus Cloacimonadaceae bacterium]|jgi:tetratricopeptide (TPR) repeat protein|nr:tetratricopeptide repeat protein [Candidatus Cloacimonadota bacterium]MDY0126558.1 tetratricopeptide repeat protein [Candidatus Cloacimonadaceae bacterium]MCB5254634.1 tetratricopeptide repeat protein [Candidatus Cloacimonadota bacterium]MCK9177721.1 tetratricopeptide repeat protein [Candidatus Cloacimonadota bacterium]MCK9241895.1 tetratricopeptide repeat protein [Candidatus Cloacimonadota bacterium]
MFSLSPKDRCKKCRSERALRLCPRIDKGLCWRCCNDLRIDLKCPDSCPYAPKLEADSAFPAFKADNNHEALHATKAYIDIWINKENPVFEGSNPRRLAAEDKKKTLDILSEFQYPGNFPVDYLMQKLELPYQKEAQIETPEDVAGRYLDHIIALEYDELQDLTMNNSALTDLKGLYAKLIRNIPFLKKIKRYSYIHSGLSEDGSQAIIFVELNHRDEYTLILRKEEGKWYLRQSLNGNPALYFKQNELYQSIAQILANGDDAKAYNEIVQAFRSYPDSADLFYYKALYWLLVKQPDKARQDFLASIALDNAFGPPYMHLGLINLNDKNYAEARKWFEALTELQPENADAINNLAIAYLADGDKEKALSLWRKILQSFPTYEMAKKNLEIYG